MAEAFDLSTTFIHLDDTGGAEPVAVTRSFWSGNASGRYVRVLGAIDFGSSRDLHSSTQEVHPEADEVLFLASGAVDVIVEAEGTERSIPLEAGHATVVPRGVWHRLVVREPGRILFINSRARMESRPRRKEDGG